MFENLLENLRSRAAKYLDKKKLEILLPPLKWVGIVMGIFVINTAVLGSVSAEMVNSFIKALMAIKGRPVPEVISSVWYLKHPFITAWMYLRHITGASTLPTAVFITWLGLNILCVAGAIIFYCRGYKIRGIGKKRNKKDRDIEKLSFAKISFDPEKYIKHAPPDKMFLGLDDRRRPIHIPIAKLTEHIHIMGGSGTGKTSLAILPICVQAIRHSMANIVIDFKGDKMAIQALAKEAKEAGKKFYLFSLHPQLKSNTYNPLYSGNTMSKVERVMTALELIFEGEAKFYTYCQQAVFYPLLAYFDNRGVKYTMKDVYEILRSAELVEEITGDKITTSQVKGLSAAMTPYADLKNINNPESDICLSETLNNGDVVYFDLRSSVAPEIAAALGKMIAMDLQSCAAYRTEHDPVVLIAIDEFQNMACKAFKNVVSKVRSANFAIVLSNQAMGDLETVGKGFINTIATNTRTKIIFCTSDPNDADYFARISGQVIIPVESHSTGTTQPTGRIIKYGGSESDGESIHEREKYYIHPNTFLRLPFGKSVIFQRGELSIIANHAHLFSVDEKCKMEKGPYPDPEPVEKLGVKTADRMITQMKWDIIERKEQNQNEEDMVNGGQPRQPGQEQNADVESGDLAM